MSNLNTTFSSVLRGPKQIKAITGVLMSPLLCPSLGSDTSFRVACCCASTGWWCGLSCVSLQRIWERPH